MNIWRKRLRPGKQTYVWQTKVPDYIFPTYQLGTEVLQSWSWQFQPAPNQRSIQSAITVPHTMPPGTYQLNGELDIEVVPFIPERPLVAVLPGQSIQAALNGACHVLLLPGIHIIQTPPEPLVMQPGTILLGSGRDCTTIRLLGKDDFEWFITPADDCTIADVTLDTANESRGNALYFLRGNVARNLELLRCRFVAKSLNTNWTTTQRHREAILGECVDWSGLLIRDCIFDGVGLGLITDHVLIHRCLCTGLGSRLLTQSMNQVAVLQSAWLNSDRGIVIQGGRGPTTRCLFSEVTLDGALWPDNGCEGFVVEGAEFRDNMIAGLSVRNWNGYGVQLDGGTITGNVFYDLMIDGGPGIRFYATDPNQQQHSNKFHTGEIRGGFFDFGLAASNNEISDYAFVSPRPARGNQHWYSHNTMSNHPGYVPRPVVKATQPGNLIQRSTFVSLAGGWSRSSGCIEGAEVVTV